MKIIDGIEVELEKRTCIINSQSLEDTQVGYILQKYTLDNYTLGKYFGSKKLGDGGDLLSIAGG